MFVPEKLCLTSKKKFCTWKTEPNQLNKFFCLFKERTDSEWVCLRNGTQPRPGWDPRLTCHARNHQKWFQGDQNVRKFPASTATASRRRQSSGKTFLASLYPPHPPHQSTSPSFTFCCFGKDTGLQQGIGKKASPSFTSSNMGLILCNRSIFQRLRYLIPGRFFCMERNLQTQ